MSDFGMPNTCFICGQPVGRFWGLAVVYTPHDPEPDELATDVLAAGFCRLHRDEVVPASRAAVEQKGLVRLLLEPVVELRSDQVQSFMEFMASELSAETE